jgi:UDP-N-acetylmuramate dehydrogenase
LSTLGVGGAAKAFIRAETRSDVVAAHAWAAEHGMNMFVLGGGSNLVIADRGFDGLVLQVGLRGTTFVDSTLIRASAGDVGTSRRGRSRPRARRHRMSIRNSGERGRNTDSERRRVRSGGRGTIEDVTVFDRIDGGMATLTREACDFSYRMSRFKSRDADRFIVCEVSFRLDRGVATPKYPDVIRVPGGATHRLAGRG